MTKIMKKCNCFLCTHENKKEQVAYLTGYARGCEEFIRWAKEKKLKFGDLRENDLSALYTQIDFNYNESLCLRQDILKKIDEDN